ncbi:MAG: PIG-L family deacetylase [Lachnospiraceae bacterium]|nr:PIG-L family deacetylase [Lachnospiraceae bacterium]
MNVLAIGAHFDDIELGCGGALAKHAANGDHVTVFVATRSGYVSPDGVVIRGDEDAEKEGRKAVEILGAKLVCGGLETLSLEFTDDLNAKLVHLIEEENIDIIYTHHTGDVHHDHIALAKATLHAARHVPRILTYASNWYLSDQPLVQNFFVDITDYWDKKEAAIRAHETEFARAGKDWLTYFKNEDVNNGFRCKVGMAEGFHCVKWLN